MACSCKKSASQKQVSSVKQVVKKNITASTPSPQRKTITKRIIYKRPI